MMSDSYQYSHRARKKLIWITILIIVGLVLYRYAPDLAAFTKSWIPAENSAQQLIATQIQKHISLLPPPLRAPKSTTVSAKSAILTRAGIILYANLQRSKNGGLPSLAESNTLDTIARARLHDIFQKQYFAHVAPNGGSAETVAKSVGYDYLAIGENLALGYYAGDKGVVEAWMNSPGHRANILNTHYTEIGVAAGEGMFEGSDNWIAVQVFGRPASDCPAPDPNLKAALDASESQLSQMETEIQTEKSQLDAMEPKHGPDYNQKVDEYNSLIHQYNTIFNQTKIQISIYNEAVTTFNQCLGA